MSTSPSLNKELVALALKCGAFQNEGGHGIPAGTLITFEPDELAAFVAALPSALHVEGAEALPYKCADRLNDCGQFCGSSQCFSRGTPSKEGAEPEPTRDDNELASDFEHRLLAWQKDHPKEGAGQVEAPVMPEEFYKRLAKYQDAFRREETRADLAERKLDDAVAAHEVEVHQAYCRGLAASPSEGGGEPTPVWSRKMPLHPGCEHACQQAQDYGVWPESSCRPTCAYLAREPHPEDIEGNLAASRGEA